MGALLSLLAPQTLAGLLGWWILEECHKFTLTQNTGLERGVGKDSPLLPLNSPQGMEVGSRR